MVAQRNGQNGRFNGEKLDDSGDPEKLGKSSRMLKDEIRQNRLQGLSIFAIYMKIILKLR